MNSAFKMMKSVWNLALDSQSDHNGGSDKYIHEVVRAVELDRVCSSKQGRKTVGKQSENRRQHCRKTAVKRSKNGENHSKIAHRARSLSEKSDDMRIPCTKSIILNAKFVIFKCKRYHCESKTHHFQCKFMIFNSNSSFRFWYLAQTAHPSNLERWSF